MIPVAQAAPPSEALMDGRHDFDFLVGTWKVQNRRLAKRLQGCEDWIAFDAEVDERPLLGGLGNLEQYRAVFPDGLPVQGIALRLFDPATRLWSIHWADDRRGQLDPALIGRFDGPRGTFYGEDTFEGRPIRVRFLWISLSPTEASWEQAFSEDGGASWETNWTMRFLRVSDEGKSR